jgi:hypothetical protein
MATLLARPFLLLFSAHLLTLGISSSNFFVILLLVAFSAVALLQEHKAAGSLKLSSFFNRKVFTIYYVCFVLAWSTLLVVQYYSVEYFNFDTGILCISSALCLVGGLKKQLFS